MQSLAGRPRRRKSSYPPNSLRKSKMAKMRKRAPRPHVSGRGGGGDEAAAAVEREGKPQDVANVPTGKMCSSGSLTAETQTRTVAMHGTSAKQIGAGSATATGHQIGVSISAGHGRSHVGMAVVAAAALEGELTARSSGSSSGAAAPPRSTGATDLGAAPSGATAPREAFQRGGGIDLAAALPAQGGKNVELATVVAVAGAVVTKELVGVSVAVAGVPGKATIDKHLNCTHLGVHQKDQVALQCVQTPVTTRPSVGVIRRQRSQ